LFDLAELIKEKTSDSNFYLNHPYYQIDDELEGVFFLGLVCGLYVMPVFCL